MPIRIPLVAEFQRENSENAALHKLDRFRASVLPSTNYGITLYRPRLEKPDDRNLRCESCGNTKDFVEHSYRPTTQPFALANGGPEYGSFEWHEESHPLAVECRECGNVVWEIEDFVPLESPFKERKGLQ